MCAEAIPRQRGSNTMMEESTSRLLGLRKPFGYAAALAVTPYLIIKIAWTFGLFVPTEQMGDANWRALNAVTVVLAAVGILLALAFSQPWGKRLPAWVVAIPVWVGTGLLVPMVLLAPVLGPAAMTRDQEAGAADVWIYEQVLVMVSLIGIGVGLPVALAGYARLRWPEALGGPLVFEDQPGHTRPLQMTLARLVAAGCILLAAARFYWAAGGTLGINPSMQDDRDMWWYTLSLSTAAWALAGAWGVVALAFRRDAGRFLPPMAAAWISSGMLFSYGVYNRVSDVVTDARPRPEYPLAWELATEARMVLGVMMLMMLLLVLHDRRVALRGAPAAPDTES